jgi:hypothetical protein
MKRAVRYDGASDYRNVHPFTIDVGASTSGGRWMMCYMASINGWASILGTKNIAPSSMNIMGLGFRV